MAKRDEITYIPDGSGGRVRTTVRLEDAEFTSSYPVGDAGDGLRQLLQEVSATVQEVTYVVGEEGTEVQIMLEVGSHRFVATLPVDSGNADLKPLLDRLVAEAEQAQLKHVQSLFNREGAGVDAYGRTVTTPNM